MPGVQLPVGNLDIYIVAYDGTNGAGNVLASSVTTVYLNSNGTLTNGPGGSAATLNSLGANLTSVSVTLPAALQITPAGVPVPNATFPASVVSNTTAAAYGVVTTAGTLTFTNSSNVNVPSNTAISPVTISSSDTSGNTCLIYVKAGYTPGTTTFKPCTFPSPGATPAAVQLTNTNDTYAVQYNDKPLALTGFKINATVPNATASATPAPQTVTVTPRSFQLSSASTVGSYGTIVYDSTGKNVYVGTTDKLIALVSSAYSTTGSTQGYQAAAAVTSATGAVSQDASVAGCPNTAVGTGLTAGGPGAIALGPDNNIWFGEQTALAAANLYVGVYAANGNAYNSCGTTVAQGKYAEYKLTPNASAKVAAVFSYNNFIYVTDTVGDMWRIDPFRGTVCPNGATCTTNVASNTATAVKAGSTALAAFAGNAANYNNTWYEVGQVTGGTANVLLALSLSSASPSTTQPLATATAGGNAVGTGAPESVYADSSGVYAVDTPTAAGAGTLIGYLTPTNFLQTPALQQFPSAANGGLGRGFDGTFFTLASILGGADYVPGISTTATALAAGVATDGAAAACRSGTGNAFGTNGFILGPDNTVLFAPNIATGTATSLCAVVY